jgi:arylsulfatase A-like enzyme
MAGVSAVLAGLGVLGVLGLVSLGGCGGEPGPSIVLITVDTLRADALEPYRAGAATAITPRISQLARDSTLFERAAAPMGLTRPSHFSIFTGRYPREHGVVNNQISLPDSEQTIAELLQAEGYRTGAFVAVNLLGKGSGALQGFEHSAAPETQLEWPAVEVVARATQWLDTLPTDAPFFLWLHLFDPHQPYDPPGAFRKNLDPALAARFPKLGWSELLQIAKRNRGHISAEVVEHSKALYRAEIAAIDAPIGVLLDKVDALRPRDRSMIVFTADHGECFENGIFFEHSECLFDGGIRVPLMVRHAPQFEAGLRVSQVVGNADIAPTILRAAGVSVPASMTVAPLQASEGESNGYVLLQNPFHAKGVLPARLHRQVVIRRIAGKPVSQFDPSVQKIGIVSGDWKYLRSKAGEELYASPAAPGAEKNVSLRNPDARAEMSALLDRALERHPLAVLETGAINPELLQSLRTLGYVE